MNDHQDACDFTSELNEAFVALLDGTELVTMKVVSIGYDRVGSPRQITITVENGGVYLLEISKI